MSEQKSTRKWLQVVAGVVATLGGFTLGLTIGWSSPAQQQVIEDLGISDDQFSWIASVMTLGAASSAIFMALTFDIIGRKWMMICVAPFYTLSWALLAFSNSMFMYCLARFLCGFCGGCFCVAAPNYTAELAEVSIRGLLGTLFQLMVCSGIMVCFILGEINNLYMLSLPCAVFPMILCVSLFFLHDSPVFLLKKKKEEQARKALQFFRGPDYDINPEISKITQYIESSENESKWTVFKKKPSLKASAMLLVLHVGQQMSGINIVMFYAHDIFKQAGSHIAPGISSIILGLVQVIATAVCTGIVDRLGRRLLWIISICIMITCLILLGIFFIILNNDPDTAKKIGFLPLGSLCLYLVGFSLGSGPLPWAMLGELLPSEIKSSVGSAITCTNWLMAFLVTVSFPVIVEAVGAPAVYFGFAILQVLTLAFIVLFLIETKGKTLEGIQEELAK